MTLPPHRSPLPARPASGRRESDGDGDAAPDARIAALRSAEAEAVDRGADRRRRDGALGAITLAASHPRRRFSAAEIALAQELGRRIGTAVANARRNTRRRSRIAHTLQQALLPQSLPLSATIRDARRVWHGAAGELNEVGGDFYDVLEHDEDRWLVLIGDVCGKGSRAAGVTALARHTLRAAAISGQEPARMLNTLHQALLRRPNGIEPCTACVVLVHPGHRRAELTVALAGHHPPLLIGGRAGARAVGRAGTLLGVLDPIDVHETTAELRDGETLLLYTDGVIDAGRADGALGERGLIELCTRAAERHPRRSSRAHPGAGPSPMPAARLRDIDIALRRAACFAPLASGRRSAWAPRPRRPVGPLRSGAAAARLQSRGVR